MINEQALKDRLQAVARERNIHFNACWKQLLLERSQDEVLFWKNQAQKNAEKIFCLEEQLAWFKRQLFGKKDAAERFHFGGFLDRDFALLSW